MGVEKMSVSFDLELGEAIKVSANRNGQSVSAWLADAARWIRHPVPAVREVVDADPAQRECFPDYEWARWVLRDARHGRFDQHRIARPGMRTEQR